jgi:hypothetical protein
MLGLFGCPRQPVRQGEQAGHPEPQENGPALSLVPMVAAFAKPADHRKDNGKEARRQRQVRQQFQGIFTQRKFVLDRVYAPGSGRLT